MNRAGQHVLDVVACLLIAAGLLWMVRATNAAVHEGLKNKKAGPKKKKKKGKGKGTKPRAKKGLGGGSGGGGMPEDDGTGEFGDGNDLGVGGDLGDVVGDSLGVVAEGGAGGATGVVVVGDESDEIIFPPGMFDSPSGPPPSSAQDDDGTGVPGKMSGTGGQWKVRLGPA